MPCSVAMWRKASSCHAGGGDWPTGETSGASVLYALFQGLLLHRSWHPQHHSLQTLPGPVALAGFSRHGSGAVLACLNLILSLLFVPSLAHLPCPLTLHPLDSFVWLCWEEQCCCGQLHSHGYGLLCKLGWGRYSTEGAGPVGGLVTVLCVCVCVDVRLLVVSRLMWIGGVLSSCVWPTRGRGLPLLRSLPQQVLTKVYICMCVCVCVCVYVSTLCMHSYFPVGGTETILPVDKLSVSPSELVLLPQQTKVSVSYMYT